MVDDNDRATDGVAQPLAAFRGVQQRRQLMQRGPVASATDGEDEDRKDFLKDEPVQKIGS